MIDRVANFVARVKMKPSYFCVTYATKGTICIVSSLRWKLFLQATGFAMTVKIK